MPVGKADLRGIYEGGVNLAKEQVGSAGGGMEECPLSIGHRVIDAPTGAGGIESRGGQETVGHRVPFGQGARVQDTGGEDVIQSVIGRAELVGDEVVAGGNGPVDVADDVAAIDIGLRPGRRLDKEAEE